MPALQGAQLTDCEVLYPLGLPLDAEFMAKIETERENADNMMNRLMEDPEEEVREVDERTVKSWLLGHQAQVTFPPSFSSSIAPDTTSAGISPNLIVFVHANISILAYLSTRAGICKFMPFFEISLKFP